MRLSAARTCAGLVAIAWPVSAIAPASVRDFGILRIQDQAGSGGVRRAGSEMDEGSYGKADDGEANDETQVLPDDTSEGFL